MLTRELVIGKLKEVLDPELDINIVDLGLFRDLEFGEYFPDFDSYEYIKVTMTLTSPMCPFADQLIQDVETKILELGKGDANVELSFDPPWECPENLKLELGL